jgi:hypothetical protein
MIKLLALIGLLFTGALSIAKADAEDQDSELTVVTLPLTDVISIGDLTLGLSETKDVLVPATSAQSGKQLVLRFHAYAYTSAPAGGNYNLEIAINSDPVSRLTPKGKERLLGRKPTFQFRKTHPGKVFYIFSENMITRMNVLFAPNIGAADQMTMDGQGSGFALNISDIVTDAESYTITFRNTRARMPDGQESSLVIESIEVGWMDEALLP